MKKIIYLFSIISTLTSYSQDTTDFRIIVVEGEGGISFYLDESTPLTTVNSVIGQTYFAVFTNPEDSLLYAIISSTSDEGNRNLFKINPFNNEHELVHDIEADYVNTADIGNDNFIYFTQGFGSAGSANVVSKLDLSTMTESTLYTSSCDDSRALEFNRIDSSLYIFEGRSGTLLIYDLAEGTESIGSYGTESIEVHGSYLDSKDSSSYLTTYHDGIFKGNYPYDTYDIVSDIDIIGMDICAIEYTLRAEGSEVEICPGDSSMISLIYETNSVTWYKDDVNLDLISDTIYASTPGVYQALIEIGDTENFMWSEKIVISHATVPVVNLTQEDNDTLICPDEIIILDGASEGLLQWYLNGEIIDGATENTYSASESGSYNQIKTNISGCSDSADVAYIIYDDPDCPPVTTGIGENDLIVDLYPNPAEDFVQISAKAIIQELTITDLSGKVISIRMDINSQTETFDISSYPSGVYFVSIKTSLGEYTEKMIK